MKNELHFAKAKGKNHPDANKPCEILFDESGLSNLIPYNETNNQSYNGSKIDLQFEDEWRYWKHQIKVPDDLSKSITKDAIKKFGI